jgi:hypothetical protein
MTRTLKLFIAALVVLAAAAPLQPAQARAPYSQAQLDQMLAPIALYPDALLTQILLAATRPHEVTQAADWVRANPGLQGDDAVRMAQPAEWDPSVKSLVAFPHLLERMAESIDWTRALGEAFIVQEPVVMETVQELRRRARAAGNLAPDDRLQVYDDERAIVIEPVNPQIVYIPYYDPWLVYGPWWWSAYPPFAWSPWPGYVVVRRPGVSAGFWWGSGIGVSTGVLYGSVDWYHRRVRVPAHPRHTRPATTHRASPPAAYRLAPAPAAAPSPRIERRAPSPAVAPSPRIERHAPATAQPGPRFTGRAPESHQSAPSLAPLPERTQSAPTPRVERASQARTAQPQRAQPVPSSEPQRIQPTYSPQTQRLHPSQRPQRAQPAPVQVPQLENAPKPAPARAAPEPRRNGGDRPQRRGQP